VHELVFENISTRAYASGHLCIQTFTWLHPRACFVFEGEYAQVTSSCLQPWLCLYSWFVWISLTSTS